MGVISVIGSGFSGLSAACFTALQGHQVHVFDKHTMAGGRARVFAAEGFRFDMGPSWYWMPDVFEDFFACFGKKPGDYYELKQLDPGFQVIFEGNEVLEVPAGKDALIQLFEQIEPGSSLKLQQFLEEAAFKYRISMQGLVRKPALSWLEYATPEVLKGMLRSNIFTSVSSYVRRYFKDPRLIALLEFPVLFLGAMPDKIPALYTLMNHAALSQGTFYPMGGMYRVVEAMQELAVSLGVQFHLKTEVSGIRVSGNRVAGLDTSSGTLAADGMIASADYHHVEQQLLPEGFRNYKAAYWDKKTLAPSCLIFFIGVRKRLPRLLHHNLFFDTDFNRHSQAIYKNPAWPEQPLFYVCCPSKTDDSVAPEGMENLFVLVPVAAGLQDSKVFHKTYIDELMTRMETFCGTKFRDDIVFMESYSVNDFKQDYHAYKGNAYGLANTLRQTAVLKPSLRNRKLSNLVYAGQLTVPGPGVPPALISGQIASAQLLKTIKS